MDCFATLAMTPGLIQIRAEPALGLLDRNGAPRSIVFELVAPDPRDSKILAVAVAKGEAGSGLGRKHREILGQRPLARVSAEHLEQDRLQAVVRACRIAG